MATAAELLAARASGTSVIDKTLVIDNYLRMIQIPSSITNLGVENDDDVLRLNFRMPRYLGKTDLSTFSVRINYLNAKGESDVYTVSDLAIVGDNLTFSWLVGPTATKYKGNTKFNVCMRIVDADAYVQKEYNTTIATLPVLEGLECEESVVEYYSDILEQWRRELFGIGDTEETKLQEKSEEEQQKIVDKGIEVLATIPEDYQSTYEMANNAYRTRANAIVSTERGEIVCLGDSSNDPLRGLRVFGKTTQVTTTGKNLIPMSTSKTANGVTMTVANDGVITLNGTATGNAFSQVIHCNIPAGSYVFSANNPMAIGTDSSNSPYLAIRDASMGWYLNAIFTTANFTKAVTFGVEQTTVLIAVPEGVTVSNFTLRLQLEEGSAATEYEPYSGGVASPSPEWHQDLNCVENPAIDIYGKNLLKPIMGTASNKGVTLTSNGDGSFTVKGTSTGPVGLSLTDLNTNPIYLHKGETYTQSIEILSGTKPVWAVVVPAVEDVYGARTFNFFTDNQTKTVTKDYRFYSYTLYLNADVTADYTFRVQLERNDKATAYESYKEKQAISTHHTLRGIPVSQNGNYTDSNGQQWICDEIDFERGVYIQRIATNTFDGTKTWAFNQYTYDTVGLHVFGTYVHDIDQSNYNSPVYCDKLSFQKWGNQSATNGNKIYTTPGYIQVYLADQSITTTEMFTNWVNENPITVQYILTAPIETELTAEELVAFGKLHTNYPNTTILNDAGAGMEVKYNEDLKFYADEIMQDAAETVITQDKIQAAVDNWLAAHYSTAEGVSF